MKVLDRYSVLLLDLNGTFMFDGDRFRETENFYPAYCELGGKTLSEAEVNRLIRACYTGMMQDYRNPACYDNFPSVQEGLCRYANASAADLPLLEQVFTHHELGTVTSAYADYLRQLSQTHRLALVSNIWATKTAWLEEFERAGISSAFECLIFSSDGHSIKPSPVLYQQSLEALNASPDQALFVGDSLRCDIEGANAVGIATVWINEAGVSQTGDKTGSRPDALPTCVDYVISDLLHLDQLIASADSK